MNIKWEDGFKITVKTDGKETGIIANRAGLISLANILRTLADEPDGSHIHLDAYNSLEESSAELILEKE